MGNVQLLNWINIFMTEDICKHFKCCINTERRKGTCSSSNMEEKFLLEYIYSEL